MLLLFFCKSLSLSCGEKCLEKCWCKFIYLFFLIKFFFLQHCFSTLMFEGIVYVQLSEDPIAASHWGWALDFALAYICLKKILVYNYINFPRSCSYKTRPYHHTSSTGHNSWYELLCIIQSDLGINLLGHWVSTCLEGSSFAHNLSRCSLVTTDKVTLLED